MAGSAILPLPLQKLDGIFDATTFHSMNKIGIPKLFWDAFELALSTKTRQLARDIADSLGKDVTPLLKSLTSESVGVYLFDEAEQNGEFLDMRCSHYTPVSGKSTYVTVCLEAVIYSANPEIKHTTCLYHSLHPCPKNSAWVILTPFIHEDVSYYIDKLSGEVYNSKGKLCGRYSPNKGARVFENVSGII